MFDHRRGTAAIWFAASLFTSLTSFAQGNPPLTNDFPSTVSLDKVTEAAFHRAFQQVVLEDRAAQPAIVAELTSPYFGPLAFAPGQVQTQQGAANPTAPSLGDLGFPTDQTQSDPQEQARLDKRSHMLKMHQRLGLITTVPLVATLFASGLAGGKSTSSTGRDIHAALGITTVGLYATTASYAIFAPKITGTTTRGPIRLHKTLAWVHGAGMILTPILGSLALDQKNKGEKVHGIASAHGAVAAVTAIAYGVAIASVSFKF